MCFVHCATCSRTSAAIERQNSMRISIPSIWLSLTSLACVPTYAVVPRNGDVSIIGITDGLTLSAFEQQWNGYPRDLADSLTPISVEVANRGTSQVRVSY